MSSQPQSFFTPEEYLTLERRSETRSEYFDGQIFAMTGASLRHNLIAGNILASLHAQLRERDCQVYASDMRLLVKATGLYTYPDVLVVCGEPLLADDEYKDTLLNPVVLVEVLSKSTAGYDRGEKFEHYRRIESLAEYLLVAQDKHHVEHFVRQPDRQWLLSETSDLQDTVQLPSISCGLKLSDVYEKVTVDG